MRLSNVLYRRLWCMRTQCIFVSIYESVAPSVVLSALVLSFALRSHRPAFIDESASCGAFVDTQVNSIAVCATLSVDRNYKLGISKEKRE